MCVSLDAMARPVGFWLNLFELAKQLGNVQKACTRMKVSRDSYYRMRKRRRGKGGLEPRPRRGAARVSPKIEKGVLDFTYSAPELGKGASPPWSARAASRSQRRSPRRMAPPQAAAGHAEGALRARPRDGNDDGDVAGSPGSGKRPGEGGGEGDHRIDAAG